jgi:hypothetical protein
MRTTENRSRKSLTKMIVMLLACLLAMAGAAHANEPNAPAFAIRGTLPWHNFLSGPTAWNEADYEQYLDRLKDLGLNFVGFHCYTGGAERYAPYVEPMIRIEYRNVVPLAGFDTSLTARWGYRPLKVRDFAFGTSRLFDLSPGAKAFGADCAILAKDNEDAYRQAQIMMQHVLAMAHARGIQMAMGFEFGIHPPEFASIVPPQSRIAGTMLPDPTHPSSIEILRATIDNILHTYPGIDWIWLWLHEHTMYTGQAALSGELRAIYEKDAPLFAESGSDSVTFTGVWSLAYLRQAYAYIHEQAPNVRIALGGWGGGVQLPGVLAGLDKALPRDIVFTCLNPGQGTAPQPAFLAEIAKNRPVWAIPWLEGDQRLWHLQPRVTLMREHVKLAHQQQLDGVVAIHWRTEETRLNLDTFARFARDPEDEANVEDIYRDDCASRFGEQAGAVLAPILAKIDREGWLNVPNSPEYFPYAPQWGRINEQLEQHLIDLLGTIEKVRPQVHDAQRQSNLDWLKANLKFTLLLDEVSRKIEPAYRLKNDWLTGRVKGGQLESKAQAASAALKAAPIEELFTTYAKRVRSRGELGVLSSLNQRLWLQYVELVDFLKQIEAND